MRWIFLGALALAACRERGEVKDGRALFGEICARCHGPDGRGDPVAKLQLGVPDMTDPAWQARLTDDDIWITVRKGSRSKKMPGFGDTFTSEQLDSIIKHVRSFSVRATRR
jgi:mono/diheme cytochrome c family protein